MPSIYKLAVVPALVAMNSPYLSALELNEREYFAAQGCEVLVFSNWYDGLFSDAKIAGVEMIHHGVRTVTNGDVRLSPTPEQWDPVPALKERRVLAEQGAIEASLGYDAYGFDYTIRVTTIADGVKIEVLLDQPLPKALEGKAGFGLEFLPSAYFRKSFLMDNIPGLMPRYPTGPGEREACGSGIVRLPFASGKHLVLAPEDPERRVGIHAEQGSLQLFDGRNQAQNGWFVVRSLIPGETTGTVIAWTLTANCISGWVRPAVIGHSQVGYHPMQRKVVVIERDVRDETSLKMRLLRIAGDGSAQEVYAAEATPWGDYLRYRYATFDFSQVQQSGLYVIEGSGVRSHVFRIARDVYDDAWKPTLDIFFPVQMDHMTVREAYRVWHGRSHMDDARQAPPNLEHFDLYAMGPETDSPFEPGAHIPGLAVGGWFDAGDYDLRTQTHYSTVRSLSHLWQLFRPERDETTVDQERGYVEIHKPDGVPDLLQQIEHGTLMLLVQHRVFGHAIPGIVEPDLKQYTHLGDGVTKTDGRIHDPGDPDSPADDRLAFTTNTTALNYGSAAALAAASRALRGYREELAEECLQTALRVWEYEKGRAPNLFHVGNTTGGNVGDEEITCATELLITTGDRKYADALRALWPVIEERFMWNVVNVMRALPHMDDGFRQQVRVRAIRHSEDSGVMLKENPYGVPITRGGWAGNGAVVAYGMASWYLHTTFPDLFPPDAAHRALEYLFGCHPDSSISFVSGVGTHSKEVAYGTNRADFSFIAGGVVPGVLILKPDFPENKEDWPFLWGQNEYVIDLAANYMLLVHLARDLLER
jgi:endoglucanase